jgi:hypothetical protein
LKTFLIIFLKIFPQKYVGVVHVIMFAPFSQFFSFYLLVRPSIRMGKYIGENWKKNPK